MTRPNDKLGRPVIPLGEHRLAAYRPRHQSTSRCHHDLCVAGTKAYARGSGSQLRIASSSASHSRRAAAKSSVIALPVCPYWPGTLRSGRSGVNSVMRPSGRGHASAWGGGICVMWKRSQSGRAGRLRCAA
jgi:hypothetical protein